LRFFTSWSQSSWYSAGTIRSTMAIITPMHTATTRTRGRRETAEVRCERLLSSKAADVAHAGVELAGAAVVVHLTL
jgi:hypothetical protein